MSPSRVPGGGGGGGGGSCVGTSVALLLSPHPAQSIVQTHPKLLYAEVAPLASDASAARAAIKKVVGTAAGGEGRSLPAETLRLIETFRTLAKAAPTLKERDVRVPEPMAPVTRQLDALRDMLGPSRLTFQEVFPQFATSLEDEDFKKGSVLLAVGRELAGAFSSKDVTDVADEWDSALEAEATIHAVFDLFYPQRKAKFTGAAAASDEALTQLFFYKSGAHLVERVGAGEGGDRSGVYCDASGVMRLPPPLPDTAEAAAGESRSFVCLLSSLLRSLCPFLSLSISLFSLPFSLSFAPSFLFPLPSLPSSLSSFVPLSFPLSPPPPPSPPPLPFYPNSRPPQLRGAAARPQRTPPSSLISTRCGATPCGRRSNATVRSLPLRRTRASLRSTTARSSVGFTGRMGRGSTSSTCCARRRRRTSLSCLT